MSKNTHVRLRTSLLAGCAMALMALELTLVAARPVSAQSAAPALTIVRDGSTLLALSMADLQALPHRTIKVTNLHAGKKDETYEGVPLLTLLEKVNAPLGGNLRGKAMTTLVTADASDNYRIIFTLAELDPSIGDAEVLVADKMDGKSLDDRSGPLKLIVPRDKRPARWIRMLKTLRISSTAN